MDWGKVVMTVLIVAMWVVTFLTRHFTTRKSVDVYGLNWSESFQRRYANSAIVIVGLFFAFLIWFLWAVVE